MTLPLLVVLSLSAPLTALGGDNPDPAAYLPLFLKIVTYDEQFDADNTNAVRIGILYDKSVPQSYQQYLDLMAYFGASTGLTAAGIPIIHEAVPLGGLDAYLSALVSIDYNIVIVTAVRTQSLDRLIDRVHGARVHSFTLEPDHVSRGVAVGLDPGRGGKKIVVNLDSAKQEGAKFSAHLLRLCKILGG